MKILFSPIGNTDPIRECYDGACLHIARHYKPDLIVLFFTAEMAQRQDKNQLYTRALRHHLPEVPIEQIRHDIKDAHLYDSYLHILPQEVRKVATEYPEAELLLNLSSGTPQIKTIMAMLAVSEPNCRGIQVVSPNKGSNSKSRPVQMEDDVEELIANNFDDEPEAENRCCEPELKVISYYGEKQRLLSLVAEYDYKAAYNQAKGNSLISADAKRLLQHAMLRSRLQTEEAKQAINKYDGVTLVSLLGERRNFVEYFLLLQIAQRTGRVSELLLKTEPLLYRLLYFYLKEEKLVPLQKLLRKEKQKEILSVQAIKEFLPELLSYLDKVYQKYGGYREKDLSSKLLGEICEFVAEAGFTSDDKKTKHDVIVGILEKIKTFHEKRNVVAHTMFNYTEKDFKELLGFSTAEFAAALAELLVLCCGEGVKKQLGIYGQLNKWIAKELDAVV